MTTRATTSDRTNENMHLPTTPSKPFHLMVYTVDEPPGFEHQSELVQVACCLPYLEDDFEAAVEKAQQDTDKDGVTRSVEIVQVLKGVSTV